LLLGCNGYEYVSRRLPSSSAPTPKVATNNFKVNAIDFTLTVNNQNNGIFGLLISAFGFQFSRPARAFISHVSLSVNVVFRKGHHDFWTVKRTHVKKDKGLAQMILGACAAKTAN
jgi:hypothetical protein